MAASSSGALKRLSDCSLANAARDAQNLIGKRLKLTIPIPLVPLGRDELDFPLLRARDWATWLLDNNLWHVPVGLVRPDEARERSILRKFWEDYKDVSPSHPIYSRDLDFSRCCPMVYHGDEGRGRRRQGWLVSNFHSLLGRGVAAANEREAMQKRPGKYLKMKVNYVGHSLTNRFGHASLPKGVYGNTDIFNQVMDHAVEEALYMMNEGVQHPRTRERFYFITLYVVGDWSWIHKVGNFNRSFNNMVRGGGSTTPAGSW